jgi:RNA polymerase sigma-70 factor (ECF subfamily)
MLADSAQQPRMQNRLAGRADQSVRGRLMGFDHGLSEFPRPTLEQLMIRYQEADPVATTALIELLSPSLYRFFASQMGSRTDAEDMLQDAWLRIHRVRHTYRPSDPLLPWVYAIARCVRVDNFRKRQRTALYEIVPGTPIKCATRKEESSDLLTFDELVAELPKSQREVLTMLKVNGLSIEEVACATSSTTGAVKQKVHRAYERLRNVLSPSGQVFRKGVAS